VKLFSRMTGRKRARAAARRLAFDPSAENYLALAHEHVVCGTPQEVLRVCTEGLQTHEGDPELMRLAERARVLMLESRIRTLQSDLAIAPRPALWRELCDLMLESGRTQKAEEAAEQWWSQSHDGEALYFRARCRAELFFAERRAGDGQVAYELADKAAAQLVDDARPLQLVFEIARRVGAWQEARRAIARLLELMPGQPDLETRFRAVQANVQDARPLDRALLEVERTGAFVDDVPEAQTAPASIAVRPVLQELGAEPHIHAAVYVRGGTALVQGPTGATADRTARAVRDLLQNSRASARRLGLGRPQEITLEGEFGVLSLVPGDRGAAALWSAGAARGRELEALARLAGGLGGAA